MVVNESEALRWVTRQWQRRNGKDEILNVGGMFESFARTDQCTNFILFDAARIILKFTKGFQSRLHRNDHGVARQ